MKKKRIAIVPARAGSVRIKNKNIKNFHGSPLILNCLKQIKKTKLFDKIHVSTDSNKIAKITSGFSSADLANLINEAAINATKADKAAIDMQDFELAKDRMILGIKRHSVVLSDSEKQITAYHEAGHTLVGFYTPGHDPIYKVTISPRGPSLGHTSFEPQEDYNLYTRPYLEAKIASSLAGRMAEELIFGKGAITTGAEGDLRAATSIATHMVTKWGFSEKVGLIYVDDNDNLMSKDLVREEVQSIINKANSKARTLLELHMDKLHQLAKTLEAEETLDQSQIKAILTP